MNFITITIRLASGKLLKALIEEKDCQKFLKQHVEEEEIVYSNHEMVVIDARQITINLCQPTRVAEILPYAVHTPVENPGEPTK
jgi:flagellar motor switch protein FliM